MDRFWTGYGQVLDRFWTGFGQALERFWTGLRQVLVRFRTGLRQVLQNELEMCMINGCNSITVTHATQFRLHSVRRASPLAL